MGAAEPETGALPNLVIIGAMKCATTSLHRYLDQHPDIAMAAGKELDFFFDGPAGNWQRGVDWYASHFHADAPVRGETSPGYTSPDHADVAPRMAQVIPDARLVLLVRDPVARAVSQYHHHRRDGTEHRPMEEALLDANSQYVARGRYYERLDPFLEHFAVDRIAIVVTEDLAEDPTTTVRELCRFLGADVEDWKPEIDDRHNAGDWHEAWVPQRLREALAEAFADDVERLRELTGRTFDRWSV